MKHIIYFLFFSINLFSQTLIYSAFTPTVGDPIFSTYQIDSTGLISLAGGSNITWNVNPINPHSKQTFTVSSYTVAGIGNISTKVTSGPDNIVDIGIIYNSGGTTWSAYNIWREVFKIANDTLDVQYHANHSTIGLTFPASMGYYSSLTGAYGTVTVNNNSTNAFPISTTSYSLVEHGDATGTLNFPNLTYNNVLRVATTYSWSTTGNEIKLKQKCFDYYSLDAPKYPILSVQSYTVISTVSCIASKTVTVAFVQENSTVGLQNIDSDSKLISIFPNPTNSSIILNTAETINTATLTDITGKETKINIDDNLIHLSNFQAGIYSLKLVTRNGVVYKKIIKQDN